jgi:hypothetical protein
MAAGLNGKILYCQEMTCTGLLDQPQATIDFINELDLNCQDYLLEIKIFKLE